MFEGVAVSGVLVLDDDDRITSDDEGHSGSVALMCGGPAAALPPGNLGPKRGPTGPGRAADNRGVDSVDFAYAVVRLGKIQGVLLAPVGRSGLEGLPAPSSKGSRG